MARNYVAGDVVWCKFPYQEDPTQWSRRPGLILRVEYQGTVPFFRTAKITTTTKNAEKFIGKFISKSSKDGKSMRLDDDSFIHLENIARLPLHGIEKLTGICRSELMKEIAGTCNANGITY